VPVTESSDAVNAGMACRPKDVDLRFTQVDVRFTQVDALQLVLWFVCLYNYAQQP